MIATDIPHSLHLGNKLNNSDPQFQIKKFQHPYYMRMDKSIPIHIIVNFLKILKFLMIFRYKTSVGIFNRRINIIPDRVVHTWKTG